MFVFYLSFFIYSTVFLFFIILSLIKSQLSMNNCSRTFEWDLLVMVNALAGDGTVQAVRFNVYY